MFRENHYTLYVLLIFSIRFIAGRSQDGNIASLYYDWKNKPVSHCNIDVQQNTSQYDTTHHDATQLKT